MAMTLHEALIRIRDQDDFEIIPYYGICSNLIESSDGRFDSKHLKPLFPNWPEFSGTDYFPIKSYDMDEPDPVFVYDLASEEETMWDRNTEYGAARWRLLDFLIEETKP